MDFEMNFWVIVCCLGLSLMFFGLVVATPTGPDSLNVTENSTWSGASSGTMVNTSVGYISSLNVTATVQNTRWKAFVGWVEGAFTLDDSGGSTVYDWSLSSVAGEVYATRESSSIAWGSIACASSGEVNAEDVAMEHSGEDNISSTFSGTNTGTYVVAGTSISAGACFAIHSYVNNVSQSSDFEEFILYDTSNIVFATEIEDAATGYDGDSYDFQMIVPEIGNESFSGSTSYYLYVELN